MNKLFSWLASLFSRPEPDADNFVSNLSHEDKEHFIKFCQFVWIQGEPTPLIYDVTDEIYTNQGVTLPMLQHFELLGLLVLSPHGYVKKKFGKHTRLFYANKPTKIEFSNEANNHLDLGHVLLTDIGKRMVLSCGVSRNQAFYEYVISRWFQQGLVLSSIQLNVKSQTTQ